MTTLFHKGIPCHPPVINGVTFEDRGDGTFVGDVPEGREAEFLGIPAYSTEDPSKSDDPFHGAYPTDDQVDAMTKGQALSYAKDYLKMDGIGGNAQEVKDQVKGMVAKAMSLVKGAGENE